MRTFLKQVLPVDCLLCDLISKNNQLICDACFNTLPQNHQQQMIHPPSLDQVIALFHYEPPISSLIAQLKFRENLMIAKLFSQYWIDYLHNPINPLPECILPVPLHHQRLKERGFNQALEIAKPIGKYFKIPIDKQHCIKIKNTAAQSSLSAKKRRDNLKNAFALTRPINARHVVILDDVMTTGNTISEIATLLKKSGVAKVDAWCCAKVEIKPLKMQ